MKTQNEEILDLLQALQIAMPTTPNNIDVDILSKVLGETVEKQKEVVIKEQLNLF